MMGYSAFISMVVFSLLAKSQTVPSLHSSKKAFSGFVTTTGEDGRCAPDMSNSGNFIVNAQLAFLKCVIEGKQI